MPATLTSDKVEVCEPKEGEQVEAEIQERACKKEKAEAQTKVDSARATKQKTKVAAKTGTDPFRVPKPQKSKKASGKARPTAPKKAGKDVEELPAVAGKAARRKPPNAAKEKMGKQIQKQNNQNEPGSTVPAMSADEETASAKVAEPTRKKQKKSEVKDAAADLPDASAADDNQASPSKESPAPSGTAASLRPKAAILRVIVFASVCLDFASCFCFCDAGERKAKGIWPYDDRS
jgi:hypothetical protein